MDFITTFINGLSLGGIYAMIALGYTMVYGIAKMLNFAHGDIIMVGGYTILVVLNLCGNPILATIAAIVLCVVLGVVVEKLAYKPLRGASNLAVLITAIGVSYLLQNAALLIWTSNTKVYPSIVSFPPLHLFGGKLTITGEMLISVLTCIVIMIGLTLFTSKTKTGKAMRAVSENRDAAELMGISVNRTITITFAIGSALAAVAGVLYCSTYPVLNPTVGSIPGIKAFTAAVLGGIGSIPGTLVGGLLLGIIEIFGRAYISQELGNAIVFAVLIIILLVKPNGLLGKKVTEKV